MSSSECLQRLFITDTTGFFTFPNLPNYSHYLGRAVRPTDAVDEITVAPFEVPPPVSVETQVAVPGPNVTADRPCWLKMIRGVGYFILFLGIVCSSCLFCAGFLLYLYGGLGILTMIMIGYFVAFVFHIASCGYLFRFVEFTYLSCCLGRCGRTVDFGGPDGQGFPEGGTLFGAIFVAGGGGVTGLGRGGGGDGGGGGC